VARRRAVGDQRHRQVGGVGRVVEHLDVEHRGQAAKALRADAQGIDLFVQFEAQFLGTREFVTPGATGFQLLDVHRRHDGFLGQQHGLFRRAANADSQDAGRAPAGAHGRHRLEDPLDQVVGGVQHGELGLGLRAATLGGTDDFEMVAGDDLVMHHGRSIVLRVLARAGRVGQHRGAQRVVRVAVGAAHAFVDHVLHRQRGLPAQVHADLEEHQRDARVLADRAVALGRHAAVGEDLRDGVLRRGRLLALVSLAQRRDVVERVVVADELEGVGDGLDEIFLANRGGHGAPPV
jgi:hypothetical protein